MPNEKIKQFQYFPGHMKKALNKVNELLSIATGAIIVLDSRAPDSSMPIGLKKMIEQSKLQTIIYLLSKKDLCDEEKVNEWFEQNKTLNTKFFLLDLTQTNAANNLLSYMQTIKTPKDEKYLKLRFPLPLIDFLILGIPNVGKSTLINTLYKKKRAQVENKPGKTKNTALFKITDRVEVIDTPGVLEPNYENEKIIKKLALLGSVKMEVLPFDDLFDFLVNDYLLKKHYNNCLAKYNIKEFTDTVSLIENVGKEKLILTKGGIVDYDRTKMIIFKDFQEGRLGKVFLD